MLPAAVQYNILYRGGGGQGEVQGGGSMETQVEWRGDQCPGPALNIDTRPGLSARIT